MSHRPPEPPAPFAVVVNDDPTQLCVLSGLLSKAGLGTRAFTGAEAAISDMTVGTGALPALIVTDLYMPGIDGWRFCRLLRSSEYTALNHIPILVVSAIFAGDEPDRIACDLGAEAFIPSPVDGRRFTKQVQAILKNSQVRNRLRVLIVEDSRTLTGILKKAFLAHGYEADTALTIRAAVDAFRKTAYDLAVLDYHLPDGKGDILLDAFHKAKPDCVCVMMTTDPGPQLALDWMKRGAAAYLRKPFKPEYLIELCANARRERALLHVQDLLELRTGELQAREATHRTILQTAMDGFWLTDTTGHLLEANLSYCNMSGYSEKELTAMNISDLEDVETPTMISKRIQKVMASGQDRFESRHRRKDGTLFDVEVSVQYIPDGGGRLVAYLRDITGRRHAEEIQRENAEKHRLIFEFSPLGLLYFDEKGFIITCNNHFVSIIGSSKEALIGLNMLNLPDSNIVSAVRQALSGGTGLYEGDYSSVTADKVTPVRVIFDPMISEDGRILGGVGTIEDISERRRAEEERVKLEAQLRQAQKMESVGRLAGGVAHDFNNMLGVIIGRTELAMDDADPASPLFADLTEIFKAAERSAHLTRQLLAFARKQTVTPRVLNINETLEGMLKMMRRLIGEHIDLQWQPQTDLWPVMMDPSQVDQILANLCVNARDAITGVGRLTIATRNSLVDMPDCGARAGFIPGEYVRIDVSDSGCGMNPETLPHIFEPFFTTKGVGEGTGLGLATVYGAVKQNNGFIYVSSEPGQGTTFTIYLPRHVGKAGQMQTDTGAEPLARGHETILLVEDEPPILVMTAMMLKKQGYNVMVAGTPGEAIRLAREHTGVIHLLMTDVIMPEMNGRDLAKNLLSLYPQIHRLFMSGYTADIIAHHGVLDAGVHFLQKPFSKQALAAKVREALDHEL